MTVKGKPDASGVIVNTALVKISTQPVYCVIAAQMQRSGHAAAVPFAGTYDIRALVMMVESAAQLQHIALLQPRCCLQEMSQNVIFDVVSLKHCEHFMPPCHAR